eukprot:IDg4580t1
MGLPENQQQREAQTHVAQVPSGLFGGASAIFPTEVPGHGALCDMALLFDTEQAAAREQKARRSGGVPAHEAALMERRSIRKASLLITRRRRGS